jgi:membrane protein YdbS with pleckstrin-like domain
LTSIDPKTEYPRRKPNPIVALIRLVWILVVIAAVVFGIVVLLQMLDQAWWWELPILAVFGFALFVLLRNRLR